MGFPSILFYCIRPNPFFIMLLGGCLGYCEIKITFVRKGFTIGLECKGNVN